MDPTLSRRERLVQGLIEEGLDALLVSAPTNVTYLTGFSGESSFLLLTRQRAVLVSDQRFTQQIAEECPGLEAHVRPPTQNLYQATSDVLGSLAVRELGFESNHLTVAEFEVLSDLNKAISWKSGRDRVERLRAIKDETEIAQIRQAIVIAERAFVAFRALLRLEVSERSLADAMESYIRQCGGRCASFPSIIAFDERAALPHAPPTDRTLAEAQLLLVDWGASGAFYKSDLTRVLYRPQVVAARGNTGRFEEVYRTVQRAQEAAIQAIRPGVKGHQVDLAARSVITDAGYGHEFGHGLGHGLGLQVHEAPAVRPNSEVILEPGMVVTVEPGIYLKGWGGIRIEDDVLVTPEGAEVLTSLPRDLAEMRLDL